MNESHDHRVVHSNDPVQLDVARAGSVTSLLMDMSSGNGNIS